MILPKSRRLKFIFYPYTIMTEKKNILLCGYWNIWQRMYPEYKALGDVDVYDPNVLGVINDFSKIKDKYDFAILCLPTPTTDWYCDTSVVIQMIDRLHNIADVIVVRSTVPVWFTKEAMIKYGNVIFCPEFYWTTQHQAKNDYLILWGRRDLCNKYAQLYYNVKSADFKIKFYDDSSTAEMIKYMENCFLATKVVFCNSFALACKSAGIEYDDVREWFLMDERMNPSHTIAYEWQPYYDSHCFNKDIPAFANQFDDEFMKAVDEINSRRKYLFHKYS